jgi:hypothetical protein
MKSRLLGAISVGVLSLITTSSHAVLVDNGGGLIYDTVLNITWAQPDTATRNWREATTWASGLTLGGVTGWRLPYLSVAVGSDPFPFTIPPQPVDCSTATELACRDNEFGYLFYHNLGGTTGNSILTSSDPDLALFPTLRDDTYWSGTGDQGVEYSFYFDFYFGAQAQAGDGNDMFTWAVHDGNVGGASVTVDIKPCKKTKNIIDLKKDKILRVAIVGDATFDALQVDPETVKFGPNAASPVRYKGKDYNRDGFSDLILTFNLDETGIACRDTEASLTAHTYEGVQVAGTDFFKTVGCKPEKDHGKEYKKDHKKDCKKDHRKDRGTSDNKR